MTLKNNILSYQILLSSILTIFTTDDFTCSSSLVSFALEKYNNAVSKLIFFFKSVDNYIKLLINKNPFKKTLNI